MNNKELEKKTTAIINSLIYEKGYICSVDVLLRLEYLTQKDYEDWRFGRVPYLEKVCKVNLKKLAKTIRIQTTLKILLNDEISSLTDLAYENEYFDQAHFIKEFKEFTGLTPKEFFGDDLKMSLIFDKK